MNSDLLRGHRVMKGKSRKDMAEIIEKSYDSYAKKEQGQVIFSPDEIPPIAKALDLTIEQINAIFFDCKLPLRNNWT